MKTSIKLNSCSELSVSATEKGGGLILVSSGGQFMTSLLLTPDQIGVLIFALEQIKDPEFMTVAA